jgi:hypothetical protein
VSSRSADIAALSEELAEYLKPKLEELFISLASASGWPQDIIIQVAVVVKPDLTLTLEYPPTIKDRVENLEYGAVGEMPNAVIRPFMLRAPKHVEAAIKDKALASLLESVVSF